MSARRSAPAYGQDEIVKRSKSRDTGTTVLVVFGLLDEDSPELRWWTICEGRDEKDTHAGLVGHTTRRDAFGWSSRPSDWCPVCQHERETEAS